MPRHEGSSSLTLHPALYFTHIGLGTAGLLTGAVALGSRKGSRLHRTAENFFFTFAWLLFRSTYVLRIIAIVGVVGLWSCWRPTSRSFSLPALPAPFCRGPTRPWLLAGLVDGIIGEVQDATSESSGADWRAALRDRCLTARDLMVRHPWAPGLIGTRATIPASVIFYYEDVLRLLIDGGFSYALAHKALHALGSMSLGFVQELFSPGGSFDADAAEAEFEQLAARLPNLTAMAASEIHANDGDVLGWCDSRAEFEFTLDLLLEGLERRRTAGQGAG